MNTDELDCEIFGQYPVCLWAVFNLQRLLCLVIAHSAATEKDKLHSTYPGYCCDLFISHWHVEFVRWSMSFLKSFQKKFLRTKVREMSWLALLDMGVWLKCPWLGFSKVTVSCDCDSYYSLMWHFLFLSPVIAHFAHFLSLSLSVRDSLHSPWHIVCFSV